MVSFFRISFFRWEIEIFKSHLLDEKRTTAWTERIAQVLIVVFYAEKKRDFKIDERFLSELTFDLWNKA